MKHNDHHQFSALITKTAMCLGVVSILIAGLGCAPAYARKGVTETGGILKMLSVPLKDGGQADIRFEKLRRSFWAGWSGRFQGAGGHPEGEVRHYYLIIRGTIKLSTGAAKEFTWIGSYAGQYPSHYPIPQWLVIAGNDVFIEYGAVPMAYQAKCTDVVKRKRYKGTRKWRYDDNNDPLASFRYSYKWPVEYVWEDVTKGVFEQAARTGNVVSLDSNWNAAHDVCSAWSDDCSTRCSEQMDGPKMIERRFYRQFNRLEVEEAEKTLNYYPEVLHTDTGRTALHGVIAWLDPKRKNRKDNDARRMLELLYRFNADINAVDSMNRTPLQLAVELNVAPDIVDALIRHGARVLYPPCGFREAALARYPELAKKDVIREIGEADGWIDDDAYQVWVEKKARYIEDLNAAEERFIRELGLGPRTEGVESDAALQIFFLIGQREPVCRRKDPATGQEQWLARIAYPGLKDLLKQYHEIKSIPYP